MVWTGPAGVSDVVASLQRAPGSTIMVLTTHPERGDHIDSVFLAELGDQRDLLGAADESRYSGLRQTKIPPFEGSSGCSCHYPGKDNQKTPWSANGERSMQG